MPLSLSDTSPPGGMKETFMRRITFTSSTLIGVAVGPTFLKGAYMAKVHGGKKLERRGGGVIPPAPTPSTACFWTDIFTDDMNGFSSTSDICFTTWGQ